MTAVHVPVPPVPARPALAPWHRLVFDTRRVLLEHGETVVTLEGGAAAGLLPALVPLLDGTRTVEELEQSMGPSAAPAVARALSVLTENGLLLDGPQPDAADGPAAAAAAYTAAATRRSTPSEALEALRASSVTVLGAAAAAAGIADQLGACGIGHVVTGPLGTDPEAPSFVVAAPGADEAHRLDALNDRLVEREAAWLQVLPHDGRHVIVGPLFLPGSSACRTCFTLRRGACSGYEEDYGLVEGSPTRAAMPAPLAATAAGLACTLVLRWLTARDPSLPGRFYALDTGTVLRLTHHHVLRVPRCTTCGSARGRAVPLPWFREEP